MLSVLHAPVRRCVLVLGGAPPATTIYLFWVAVDEATGYRVKVGTTSMQATGDTYDSPVGLVSNIELPLASGTYYARTVVIGGAHDGELTAGGEQEVTVA